MFRRKVSIIYEFAECRIILDFQSEVTVQPECFSSSLCTHLCVLVIFGFDARISREVFLSAVMEIILKLP